MTSSSIRCFHSGRWLESWLFIKTKPVGRFFALKSSASENASKGIEARERFVYKTFQKSLWILFEKSPHSVISCFFRSFECLSLSVVSDGKRSLSPCPVLVRPLCDIPSQS